MCYIISEREVESMRSLIVLLVGIAIIGCGKDRPVLEYPDFAKPKTDKKIKEKPKTEEDITITRKSCLKKFSNSTFKYIVISYPNDDVDVYCSIKWGGLLRKQNNELPHYHHDAAPATCRVELSRGQKWSFYETLDGRDVGFYHPATAMQDARTDEILPRLIEFDCEEESWEDENWVIAWPDFKEWELE